MQHCINTVQQQQQQQQEQAVNLHKVAGTDVCDALELQSLFRTQHSCLNIFLLQISGLSKHSGKNVFEVSRSSRLRTIRRQTEIIT
jgi:hypothetical protein